MGKSSKRRGGAKREKDEIASSEHTIVKESGIHLVESLGFDDEFEDTLLLANHPPDGDENEWFVTHIAFTDDDDVKTDIVRVAFPPEKALFARLIVSQRFPNAKTLDELPILEDFCMGVS